MGKDKLSQTLKSKQHYSHTLSHAVVHLLCKMHGRKRFFTIMLKTTECYKSWNTWRQLMRRLVEIILYMQPNKKKVTSMVCLMT